MAAATTPRRTAASASKAMAVVEADGIQARADALATNQDAVIAQHLSERMPEIIRTAAEPSAHVGQITVLNSADGVNGVLGGISPRSERCCATHSSLRKKDRATGRNGSRPRAAPAAEGPNTRQP